MPSATHVFSVILFLILDFHFLGKINRRNIVFFQMIVHIDGEFMEIYCYL